MLYIFMLAAAGNTQLATFSLFSIAIRRCAPVTTARGESRRYDYFKFTTKYGSAIIHTYRAAISSQYYCMSVCVTDTTLLYMLRFSQPQSRGGLAPLRASAAN